jgi:hypothetical protein
MSAQRRFNFGLAKDNGAQWPEIIASDPVKYPGLMQRVAAMALHRAGKPHRSDCCLFCEREAGEKRARGVKKTAMFRKGFELFSAESFGSFLTEFCGGAGLPSISADLGAVMLSHPHMSLSLIN